jgi:hypothetical protein
VTWSVEQLLHVCEHTSFFHLIYGIRFQESAKRKGIALADIELLHGDFLQNTQVKEAMSSAEFVFMNNPSFGPQLNLNVLSKHCSTLR